MTSVVEDYAYIARRLREITAPVAPKTEADDDGSAANEPSDEDDFLILACFAAI